MVNIKSAAAYIFIIGLAVLYTLFLESQGGCYLIAALAAAAAISVLLCVYTKKNLIAEISVENDILNKNDTVPVGLLLKKTGVLPSSFITAELYSSYHFGGGETRTIKTAIFGNGEASFTEEYRARFFGIGRIGISSLTVSDYLGLCSFKVPLTKTYSDIRIYPDIPEVSVREGLARSLTDAAAFDDSEETTESVFAINGTPGYEHRSYEPGDSLKLINWKLSAKKGELLVRRLEGATGAEQLFILDKSQSPLDEPEEAHEAEQLAVEGMLGLMMTFAKSELPIKAMIRFGSEWETIPVLNAADLSDLRYALTGYTFSKEAADRFPKDVKGRAVMFTARCDERAASFVNASDNNCAATDMCYLPLDRIWLIKRDNLDISFDRI